MVIRPGIEHRVESGEGVAVARLVANGRCDHRSQRSFLSVKADRALDEKTEEKEKDT